MVITIAAVVEMELLTDRTLELGENKIHLFLNYFFLYKAIRKLWKDIWPGGKIKGERILPSYWRQSFGKTENLFTFQASCPAYVMLQN